jgi:hypothetical protein
MRLCKQSVGPEYEKTQHLRLHAQYSLPGDEHMMFET